MIHVRKRDVLNAGYKYAIEHRRAAGDVANPPQMTGRTISGYASVFDRDSRDLGGFIEIVGRHAFSNDAGYGWPGVDGKGAGVLARFNHSDDHLIGTTRAGTLRLRIDNAGLWYDVDPPQSRADITELVARGDVAQSSFAFVVRDETWSMTERGYPVRTLLDVKLIDVAPVTEPSYTDTSAALRNLAIKMEMSPREVRKIAMDHELGAYLRRHIEGPKRRIEDLRLPEYAGRSGITGRDARRQLERRAA